MSHDRSVLGQRVRRTVDHPLSDTHSSLDLTGKQRKKLLPQLNHVIVQTLRRYPDLHYYQVHTHTRLQKQEPPLTFVSNQGFHDICSVFLLVYGNQDTASQLASRAALFHFRYPFLLLLR